MTLEILDTAGIAKMFGVRPETVHKWRDRGLLPDPAGYISRCPYWIRSALEIWGIQTRRLPVPEAKESTPGAIGS